MPSTRALQLTPRMPRLHRAAALATLVGGLALAACGGADADVEASPAIGTDEPGAEVAPVNAPSDPDAPGAPGGFGAFAAADGDRDGRLSPSELGASWRQRGVYTRWNSDNTAGLTNEELGRGAYRAWNQGGAGLSESEWNRGVRDWFGSAASFGTYGGWDTDKNGLLEDNEFAAGVERYGPFSAWDKDRDKLVSEDELDNGIFDFADGNDDGFVAENEWRGAGEGYDWGF